MRIQGIFGWPPAAFDILDRASSFHSCKSIEAGASLIQIYTGLVYEGPGLVGRIKKTLVNGVTQAGVTSLSALTGSKAEQWAAKT